jgi:hypothetical protein
MVFSGKNAENELNNRQDDEKTEQRILEIDEFDELERIRDIGGPVVGFAGMPSLGWTIYKKIILKYPSETIEKEYFKTNSSVAKIYLYWALRERNWYNLSVIYQDLLKRGSEKIIFHGGCLRYSMRLSDIIEKKIL